MRISALIEILQETLNNYGDLPVNKWASIPSKIQVEDDNLALFGVVIEED